jgi:hypothetical protein
MAKSWKALFKVADPMMAGDRHLLLDTDSSPSAALFTRKSRQLVIPEDRDFEQILAAPEGRVDFIAFAVDSNKLSRYLAPIQALLTSNAGGTWNKVGEFGNVVLYQFVPSTSPPRQNP